MSVPRRFILKLNAIECPGGIGRPGNVADWEGKVFKADKPQSTRGGVDLLPEEARNPDPDDHLLIWINDGPNGGGAGLTALGEVSTFHSRTHDLVAKEIELFPSPRLNGTDLQNPNRHPALNDLASSRVMALRHIFPKDWDAFREAACKKVAEAASAYMNVTASEGRRVYSQSTTLERDPKLSKAVKENNKRLHGGLYRCEACAFSEDKSSLFDAHHLVPLCIGKRQTTVLDFAVLCPTCHRLAHRLGALHNPLPVSEIKSWWQGH